jgi:hypothetical protein
VARRLFDNGRRGPGPLHEKSVPATDVMGEVCTTPPGKSPFFWHSRGEVDLRHVVCDGSSS